MKTLIVLVLLSCTLIAIAQSSPDTLWTRTYGGSEDDRAYDVQQTTDGGYILTGYTHSFGIVTPAYSNCWLVKTDSTGDTQWTRTYGGNTNDFGSSVQQTREGGYILAGYTYPYPGAAEDYYLVKTDSAGDTLWTRTYGGNDRDMANSVQQTSDGGYILAGTNYFSAVGYDFYLVKADSNGDMEWEATYGGSGNDYGYEVKQTTDGGYIVSGMTQSFGAGDRDVYLVKTDSLGDTLWTRTYGGIDYDCGSDVWQTLDGGYIIAGPTRSFGAGLYDFYLVKTDSMGDTLWTRAYGGTADEVAYSVQQTADSGYIVAGNTNSFGAGNRDIYVIKVDSQGDTLWTRTFGGSNFDGAHSIQQTIDGGFIIAGLTISYGAGNFDFYLVKTGNMQVLSPNGGEEWRTLQSDTVRWFGTQFEGGVKIELNRNYPNGAWEMLVDSTENDGEEIVDVTPPPSARCRIRVGGRLVDVSDISDGDFSITSSQGYLGLIPPAYPEVALISWDAGVMECPDTTSAIFYLKNFGDEAIVVFPADPLTSSEFTLGQNCTTYFALAPDEISSCSLIVAYDPSDNGLHKDTLKIESNAYNASPDGFVRFPLSGRQISTPETPVVTISIEGDDARLTWEPITESIQGCSITVTGYLIFYSETQEGPYYFLDFAPDTSYVHTWVVRFASSMFYEGLAYTGELDVLDEILASGRTLTREEVHGVLNRGNDGDSFRQ